MDELSAVWVWTKVFGGVPANAGTGPSPPVTTVRLLTVDSSPYDISALNVPADTPVFVEVLSGGGGGGSYGFTPGTGAGGGGSGAYMSGTVPPDMWINGGTIIVGAGGTNVPDGFGRGGEGGQSTVIIDGVGVLLCYGGSGGDASGFGGAGGGCTPLGYLEDEVATPGTAGGNHSGLDGGSGSASAAPLTGTGGAGGVSGVSGATDGGVYGAGGGGGTDDPATVGMGSAGVVRITYTH